ncbi:MAG: hypothetical protein R3D05_12800 [Dongiaceae bacterium]
MTQQAKPWILAIILSTGLMAPPVAVAKDPIQLSPAASRVVEEYLAKIGGRFGALVVSADGQKAVYHICQSRLWKNCDDYELNDRYVSIPSGRLAAKEAMGQCGGECVLLYMNEKQMQSYAAQ